MTTSNEEDPVRAVCSWKASKLFGDLLSLQIPSLSTALDYVVYFKNGSDSLRGLRDGGRADEDRLNDVFLEDVGDAASPHVDARRLFILIVPISQIGDGFDGVQTGVLRQRVGDDLQCFGKGPRMERKDERVIWGESEWKTSTF